jgi:AcrR family transcriptional regulator
MDIAWGNPAGRPDAAGAGAEDATRARILDAAYEVFCARGIRHSSMEEVARRAKAARITVYRKFESKDALVDEVVLREFQRYFDRFAREVEGCETAADRVVVAFVSALRAFSGNPLLGSLLEGEPDSVIGSLIGKDGQMIATVRRFVAGRLAAEQRAGLVDPELDVDLAAEMFVRISASFLTIPTDVVDLSDDRDLERIARQFLVPMLEPRPESGGVRAGDDGPSARGPR